LLGFGPVGLFFFYVYLLYFLFSYLFHNFYLLIQMSSDKFLQLFKF
jgi:hypothetical protein